MVENIELEHLVFRQFDFLGKQRNEGSLFYASAVIQLIIEKEILEDDLFPPVEYIHRHIPLFTLHYIRLAYIEIAKKGYMEISVGRRGKVINPDFSGLPAEPVLNLVHANFPVKHVASNTIEFENAFNKASIKRSEASKPADENKTSASMINYLCRNHNSLHSLSCLFSSFHYSHDIMHLLIAVLTSLYQEGSVIIIPVNFDVVFKRLLKTLHINFVEVGMNDEGLIMEELYTAGKNHKISLIVTSSKVYGPSLINTSVMRVEEIYSFRDQVDCKILELDLFSIWVKDKRNLLIDHAGAAMKDLIYIGPLSYLLKNWAAYHYVAANEETTTLIKNTLKADGEIATRSVADAMVDVLTSKRYRASQFQTAKNIKETRARVLEVFGDSGKWDLIGWKANAGLRFALKPRAKQFPADTYWKLLQKGVEAYNPEDYGGSAEEGILLDLSQYIGYNKFIEIVYKIEEACWEICMENEKT